MGFPALDRAGYGRRSALPGDYLDEVDREAAGYIAKRIGVWTDRFYSQLRKLYLVPFGLGAPPITSQGTAPPAVALSGTPVVGSMEIVIQITTPGVLGTSAFRWSSDGGQTWTAGVTTAASVVLGSTGLSALFAAGTYSGDNLFTAPTPIVETFLQWLTDVVNLDVLRKRRVSPDVDRKIFEDEAARVLSEVEKAANSKDGLFDLPMVADTQPSAVRKGGPLFYSESSPFVSADRQEREGRIEDARGFGTGGGY